MKKYSNKNWLEYRKEVIELDGGICQTCKRDGESTVLQVHHLYYKQGLPPWEYPYDACVTLCKGCHAAEHGIIPPKTGWQFQESDDLGGLVGKCELCSTDIRYVYYIYHENWGTLQVGTDCCDALTGTEIASEHKKLSDRMTRFVKSKRWQKLSDGAFTIKQTKISVKIIPDNDIFKIKMDEIDGQYTYPSVEEAKKRAYLIIATGKFDAFMRNRKP